MIDLHIHTLLSDGALLASEVARRAEAYGYRYVGLADHADAGTLPRVVPELVRVARSLNSDMTVRVIPAVELTHVPPPAIREMVRAARELGARIVIVHGETLVEPVFSGTNRKAIEAEPDILAHPGLITAEEAQAARERGVLLEINGRKGHSLTNGHVVLVARQSGAKVIFGGDIHGPEDLVTRDFAERVMQGAGLNADEIKESFRVAENLSEACIRDLM